MIREQLNYLYTRKTPNIYTKYKETVNHLSYEKKVKLYDYYICDYCSAEIKLENNRKSNLLKLSPILTNKNRTIVIACCNKCLKKIIQELNKN